MGLVWNKFTLLVWKNYTLQKRHKLQTLVEIVIPVLFSTLLVLVRSLVEPEQQSAVHFPQFSASNLSLGSNNTYSDSNYKRNSLQALPDIKIAFSPNTTEVYDIVCESATALLLENIPALKANTTSSFCQPFLLGFPTSSALFSYLTDPLTALQLILAGVAFEDKLAGLGPNLPDHMDIVLHFPSELRRVLRPNRYQNWYTDFSFPLLQVPGPRSPLAIHGGIPSYADEGFTPLAHVLSRTISKKKGADRNSFPNIKMQRFPHPPYLNDPLIAVLKSFLPLVIMLSFVYTCINTVKAIAAEKEQQLKEVMKVMGLDNWIHWMAWFIKTYTYIIATVILIVLLLKVEWYTSKEGSSGYSVFTYTPWHFILFYLMLYAITTVCFCFMISVFFNKANTAATVAGLLWFLTFTPYSFMSNGRSLASFSARLASCLFSNAAMSFGFEIIMNHETSGEGLQWSTIWSSITEDDPLVMGHILVMLILDAVIYLLIAIYVEQVMPGAYGVPQKWYFPFTKSFWMSSSEATVELAQYPKDLITSNEDLRRKQTTVYFAPNTIDADDGKRRMTREPTIENVAQDTNDSIASVPQSSHLLPSVSETDDALDANDSTARNEESYVPSNENAVSDPNDSVASNVESSPAPHGSLSTARNLASSFVQKTKRVFTKHRESTRKFEGDPNNMNVGVHIIDLTKKFRANYAVKKLNLKIFEGQITVILGHNGAGKTTTMSMLTGLITPTSGTALVAGCDIRSNIKGVRKSLGLCPQHNVLFPDMTVEEHIYFFARLKGMQGVELQQQVDKYIRLLSLEEKRNVQSKALSGGMKRRLSVAVAMCGGSKVVLLDEPSSGIDPASRRDLWALLQADKKDRTIILSTHFMDEAEVLGDRVAVMAGGEVRAVGTPFFLKRKFNVGYTLTATTSGPASAVTPVVTALVKSHIPEATLHCNIGSELSYHLPADLTDKFEPLLKELESRHEEYKLNTFGISAGSLEDVFMKVGADAIETLDEDDQVVFKEIGVSGFASNGTSDPNGYLDNESGNISSLRFTGSRLWLDQWYAMFYKHAVTTWRSWVLALLRILIPVLFLIIAILVGRAYGLADTLPTREMTLDRGYKDSETIINYVGTLDDVTKLRMDMYMKQFPNNDRTKIINIGNASMEEYYLRKAATNMADMRKKNLVGTTFSSSEIIVWFSNFAFHDLPVSLMLAYNSIVMAVNSNYSYRLINHPLPYTLDTKITMLSLGDSQGFQIAFNVGFGMAFVSGFFILFYIKENVSKSKLIQMASGASPFIMWTSALIWDMICFSIITLFLGLTLLAFQEDTFVTAEQIIRLWFILLIFGLAMLPSLYLASVLFIIPSTGFSRMVFFFIFTGVATFLTVQVLSHPGLNLGDVSEILHWFFMIIPHYAVSDAIKRHYDGYVTVEYCYLVCANFPPNATCNMETICNMASQDPQWAFLKSCCIPEDPYFSWDYPGVMPNIMYLVISFVVLYSLLMLKEYKFLDIFVKKVRELWKHNFPDSDEPEDDDVTNEKQKIAELDESEYVNYSLLCKNMSKSYKKFLAVKNISFSVQSGGCFGLLGMNGAGKTSTFKMLMGDSYMTSGDAWVIGKSVKKQMKIVYNHIGYCPQFDALLDEMTARETLEMFARLKGIPPEEKDRYVWSLSKKLGFVKHLDKKVRELSGGNKRKVSTAVALLGDPEVVYLDEPTTGMDPVAKRQVWRAVANRRVGCVVLTSHSMEECEALCTRLAIMVNGQFKCLGSTQHLKNKFSQGYTLIVKVRRTSEMDFESSQYETLDSQPIHKFLTENFPGAHLKESYQGLLTYFLPASTNTMPWSRIFGILEEAKNTLNLEDYSIGQTSLEQIFLQFTKDQIVSET